jgi:hypothetical protein
MYETDVVSQAIGIFFIGGILILAIGLVYHMTPKWPTKNTFIKSVKPKKYIRRLCPEHASWVLKEGEMALLSTKEDCDRCRFLAQRT